MAAAFWATASLDQTLLHFNTQSEFGHSASPAFVRLCSAFAFISAAILGVFALPGLLLGALIASTLSETTHQALNLGTYIALNALLPILLSLGLKWFRRATNPIDTRLEFPIVLDWLLLVSLVAAIGDAFWIYTNIENKVALILRIGATQAFSILLLLVTARLLLVGYRHLTKRPKWP